MKKYIYLILIILLITNVNALIAGNNNTVTTIDKCSFLRVDITGEEEIYKDEYNFPFCEELEENKWYCECTPKENYNLTMDINLLTYNTYTFDIEIYGIEQKTKTRSRGTKVIYINETKDVEENQTKEKEIKKPEENQTIKYINNTETIIEEVEVEKIKEIDTNKKWPQYLIFGIILGMVLGIISLYIYIEKQIRSVKK